MKKALTLAVILVACSATAVSAQDWTADPNYGTTSLREGFTPDPQQIDLTAGGSIEVNMGECRYGYVANAPDVDIQYSTSGRSDLYIWVESNDDTTLLINTADGDWVCNDDGYHGTNPLIVIRNASEGLYDIWVGTYGSDMVSARLFVSEIDPR